MNRNEVLIKTKKLVFFLWKNKPHLLDEVLLAVSSNRIAEEPFFLNRREIDPDIYAGAVVNYLDRRDLLKAFATYPTESANFKDISVIPAQYAEVINRTSGNDIMSGEIRATNAGRGGGSGIFNLGSLEGLGDVFFTPEKTQTQTQTTTTSEPSDNVPAKKGLSATSIIALIIAVIAIILLIIWALKK